MPEDRSPHRGEEEGFAVDLKPPTSHGAIIITKVANAKWSKDGLSVYADLTDQHGQTRTFAWSREIANHLIAALSSGIVGLDRIQRGG